MAINYIYYPTIQLGPITIYTWGLIVAIGFLVGILLAVRYGKKKGFKEDDIYGLCFYVLLGAIIGARLIFIITNLDLFSNDILGVFKVWHGGMDFIGGLGGGLLAGTIFIKVKKLDFLGYVDLLAPYIAIGHAIGRLGCVLGDGGHLGKPTNLPWGIVHEGVARHPAALYEMLALIALFIVLLKLRKKNMEKGMLFASYVIGYSILRFGIDFIRADRIVYGLTGTQWGLILASIVAILWIRKIKKKKHTKKEQKIVEEVKREDTKKEQESRKEDRKEEAEHNKDNREEQGVKEEDPKKETESIGVEEVKEDVKKETEHNEDSKN